MMLKTHYTYFIKSVHAIMHYVYRVFGNSALIFSPYIAGFIRSGFFIERFIFPLELCAHLIFIKEILFNRKMNSYKFDHYYHILMTWCIVIEISPTGAMTL